MSEPPWKGDPEVLLAHAGWVRSLARTLVHDPNRADDVEQQAWLGVLEGPPAHARNLPAWLGRVVRNTARQLGRGEARRTRREERAAPADRAPAPNELVEQAEMQREVVSAVLELEEPYRTTMLLRYWRDHSPQEIAREQGVPAGTVRSRIHRAHAELRTRLDQRFEGDRSAWSLVLCAWIRAGEGTQAAGAGSASALLAGAAGMGWKISLGLSVALGAVAAWWAWPGAPARSSERGPDPAVDVADSVALLPPPDAAGRTDAASPPHPVDERDPVLVASPSPVFHGTVAAPDGSPVADAVLTLYPHVADWAEQEPLGTGTSDGAGRFRIEEYTPGPASFVIRAAAEGHRSTSVEAVVPEREIELRLAWLGALAGRVRDAETGAPLAGASIAWHRDPPAETDARGHYRLSDIPTGVALALYARAPGYAEEAARIELEGPGEETLDFELRRGSPLVVAVFDRETGAPVAGADVHGDPRVSPLTRTDADGRCEVRLLEGRELFLRVVAEGYFPFLWSHRVEETGRALAPRIPLAPLGAIEGRVTDREGRPLPGADVHVRTEGRGFGPGLLSKEEREAHDLPGFAGPDGLFQPSARTDEQGAFRIPVLPGPTPRRVVAVRHDGATATSEPVVVESSQQHPWVEVVFREGATVRGRVVCNGQPQAGLEVRWKPTAGSDAGYTESDRDGRYELADVRPGAITVYVLGNELWRFGPLPRAELVVEAGESYAQDLTWNVETARISGRVVSDSGAPLAGVRIEAASERLAGEGVARFDTTTEGDGTYAIDVRPGASYEVSAGRPFLDHAQQGVAADATDVDFVLPELGVLPVQLVDAVSGEPLEVRVEAHGLGWRPSGQEVFRSAFVPLHRDGTAELQLPVGIVDLSVYLNELGYAPQIVRGLRVTSDPPPTPVVVELSHGVEAKLVLVNDSDATESFRDYRLFLLEESQLPLVRGPFPPGDDASNYSINGTRLWVGDPGVLKQAFQLDDRGRARVAGLAPGRYAVRAYPGGLHFEPQTFEITGEESDPIEIRWRPR